MPGAVAIRAVARIALLLLIPLSMGVALALQRVRWRWLAPMLVLLLMVDQLQDIPSFSRERTRARVARIASLVPRGCTSFYFAPAMPAASTMPDWALQLDAMWVELATGVPTINGYSGYIPPGWERLRDNHVRDAADGARIRSALESWRRRFRLSPADICVVGSTLQEGP